MEKATANHVAAQASHFGAQYLLSRWKNVPPAKGRYKKSFLASTLLRTLNLYPLAMQKMQASRS